jgi:hypothetical protein
MSLINNHKMHIVIRMVKPKWILHLCWKCFYSGLQMTVACGLTLAPFLVHPNILRGRTKERERCSMWSSKEQAKLQKQRERGIERDDRNGKGYGDQVCRITRSLARVQLCLRAAGQSSSGEQARVAGACEEGQARCWQIPSSCANSCEETIT